MGEVVTLPVITSLNVPAERVLANMPEMDGVVCVGWKKETGEFYFASSIADGADVLWLLELAKKELLEITR
jgi:hypothetical protein